MKKIAKKNSRVTLLPGQEFFKKISSKLLKKYKGWIVAVHPKTGAYVLGEDELDVLIEAKEKFPDVIFSIFRVGYKATHRRPSFLRI